MKNFLPIIMIIVSLAVFYFYLRPQYFELSELRAERDRYDEVLEKSEELRNIRAELNQKLNNFSSSDLDRLEKMIPAGKDVVQLVLDMDNIAVRHGIVMGQIETSEVGEVRTGRGAPSTPSTPYKTLAISFNFESLYSNFLNFLREMEESLRIMDVVSISISPNSDQPILQDYQITVHTYWVEE